MFISMALCLLVCCLVLFFLFPRSVTLTPVSVLSVMVYFGNNSVDLQVTVSEACARLLNIYLRLAEPRWV